MDAYTQYTVILLRLCFPSLLMKMSFEILSEAFADKIQDFSCFFLDSMDTSFPFDFKRLLASWTDSLPVLDVQNSIDVPVSTSLGRTEQQKSSQPAPDLFQALYSYCTNYPS